MTESEFNKGNLKMANLKIKIKMLCLFKRRANHISVKRIRFCKVTQSQIIMISTRDTADPVVK